ncbi:hypothetical protein [Haliangium sp.]|uniref:hypothetical protein n=1 Tax=Haliangium sp. TaxID=2663208 RepID=UPI003D12F2D1
MLAELSSRIPVPRRLAAISLLALAALWLLPAGCARNVPQHENSGKDYRYKGAKKIELEDGEGRVRDIVTYPGGDRIDWKLIELPEGQQGTLRVKLRWRPPRPGLDLAFDVYDEYFDRVARAKPSPGSGDRSKGVKVKGASGKYYVMVYAPERSDAGRYTLSVRFKERDGPPGVDELAGLIEDPPTLPAVVEPEVKTPEQIAAEEEARRKAEEEAAAAAAAAAADAAAQAELNKPIEARITRTQRSSGGVIITISAGKNRSIEKGWRGTLLSGGSQNPLPGGEFTVIRVTRNECIGKVALSMDQVRANLRVELRRQ